MARFLTALTLLACSHLIANQVQRDAPTVTIDFRVFGIGKDSFEQLYFFNGSSYQQLSFHRTNRSIEQYRYRGPQDLKIYVQNPNYNPELTNSPQYLPIAGTRVGPELNEGLLIFAAAQNNRKLPATERRFRLIMIDDEQAKFPQNSLVVVNTTNVLLHGRVADERIQLKPGATPPISYDASKSKKGVPIVFALDTSDGMRLVLSNEVQLPNNRRIVLILEPPRRENSLRLEARILSESLESHIDSK